MKQMLKSLLSGLLVLAMLFTAAACDGKNTDGDKGTDKNNSSATNNDDFFTDTEVVNSNNEESGDSDSTGGTSETPADNKVGGKSWKDVLASMPKKLRGSTITVYNWNPASEYTGAPAVIEKFTKETGIKVKWQRVNYSEYVTKLDGLIATGEGPDVVRTLCPTPDRISQFQPLTAAKYDFTDAAWDNVVMKAYTVNGKTYATSLKNTHLGSVDVMFYNKALIDKYDMENPYQLWKDGKWTVDKFISMCNEYQKEAGSSNAACTGMWLNTYSQWFGYGSNVTVQKDGTLKNVQSDPKFLKIAQDFADYRNTSKIFFMGQAEVMDEGGALFYAGWSIYARKKNTYLGTLKSQGTMYIVPMPSVPGQSTYYQGRNEFEAYAIAKTAKNPEAVPYFLRYFLDGANYDLNSFFCNKQNLEVYNWCMKQENTIWTPFTNGLAEPSNDTEGGTGYSTLTGNQVKSYFDSINPYVNDYVKKYNQDLAKIK